MSRADFLMYIMLPLNFFLGILGIIIAVKMKGINWDVKIILIVTCILLNIPGFLATLIVRWFVKRRLKKQELANETKPEIFANTESNSV